ncbi:MAG: thiamine diphosphokinase, partial [Pseudomonadota bacterium]
KTLSIVPFSDVTGLSIEGVRWPLNSIEVEFGSTHTLSNEIVSEAKIRLLSGLAIAIVQTND